MAVLRSLREALAALAPGDVLDIVFVAAMIHAVLLWFKGTKAAFVATGIMIFGAFYLLADVAQMHMTVWIFRGLFAVSLVALVVIFQEEIRGFFERLAVWSLGRQGRPAQAPEIEAVVRAVDEFARARIGALIVFKGRDPLRRHLVGGTELDGRISESLLKSLFDPHSQGHDGAAIVDGGRVVRFEAHLPLSKQLDQLRGRGTRHAAALGLSERADALCLVVSEERGTVSLARRGILRAVTPAELEAALADFRAELAPPGEAAAAGRWGALAALLPGLGGRLRWGGLWRENRREKLAALGLSLTLWLVFSRGFKPAVRSYSMPVVVRGLGRGTRLAGVSPGRVRVRVIGLSDDLDRLLPQDRRVYVDLDDPSPGEERVELSEDNLRLPAAVRFRDAEPPAVEVRVAPLGR